MAIALLVPESRRQTDHLLMLSAVSEKLMDRNLRQQLKTSSITKEIQSILGFN
jgi:mannitol/fructose-specific phosphotransferase system IIA component (Ntr-type)